MKKFISVKMIIFMAILLFGSIIAYVSSFVVLVNSGYTLANYKDDFNNFVADFKYDYGFYDDFNGEYCDDGSKFFNTLTFFEANSSDIKKIDVVIVSNDIDIFTDTSTDKVTVTAKSGKKFDLTNNSLNNLISATSENGTLKLSSVTGNRSYDVDLKITIPENFAGDISIKSTSGDVTIIAPSQMQKCDITTVSGEVEVKTNVNRGFEINYETVSGELENNCDLSTLSSKFNKYNITKGDSSVNYFIKTVSGDLDIY